MLKTPMLRVRRMPNQLLRPAYVNESNYAIRKRAAVAIALFEAHVGCTRGQLDEQLAQFVKGGGDLKINKGLVELLYDYGSFQADSTVPAGQLRELLFEQGALHFPLGVNPQGPTRAEVLESVARGLGLDAKDLDRLMFSDLKEAQVLESFEAPAPPALLARYNVALAQGILLHATGMDVVLEAPPPPRLRQLFRFLKFFRLLFTMEMTGDFVAFHVDGPLSVLSQTKSYGVRLATFLPALLLLDSYQMVAELKWKGHHCKMVIGPDDGLVSHYRDVGAWEPAELAHFRTRLEELAPPGVEVRETSALVSLGGRDILVPDLVLSCGGRELLLEVIWPWRKLPWERYYGNFAKYAPENVMLVVSQKSVPKLLLDECNDERVVTFRVTPLADRVMKAARAFFKKKP